MKKLLFVTSFFLFLSFIGLSQSAGLGIGPDGITGLPETVYAGQKVGFKVQIQNKGLIPVSGPINVFAATTQDTEIAFIGVARSNPAVSKNVILSLKLCIILIPFVLIVFP